jgi:predicted extracellular nuclease
MLVALTGAGNALAAGNITISEVYGGGGNSGATFTNDFIELHNRSATAVNVTGWSVQYAATTGVNWQKTDLNGTIAPGGYYLVQQAAGAGGTTPLPTPDATGAIAMSATAGKVVVVTNNTLIASGTVCPSGATVADLVGYGSATNCSETAPTGNLTNTTSASRNGNGATDTDNNAADFTLGAPNPQNSGSAPAPPEPTSLQIAEIQGAAHISPHADEIVSTTGVVSALKPATARGFWIQDPTPDANAATSEGIFVFTNAPLTVAVGDNVRVVGRVTEFRPGGSGGTNNLTITELTAPTVTVLPASASVPAPTIIGIGGRIPPTTVIDDDTAGSVETGPTVFDPAGDGIDFYESLEGMIVQVNNAAVVGPTKSFGEFVFLPDNGSWATGVRTPRGGILYRYEDGNPERMTVDDEILRDLVVPRPPKAMVDVDVGDRITSPIVGPMDYSFANFKIQATSMPVAASGNLRPETTLPRFMSLAVATFNVENLDPSDGPTIGRLAAQIVDNLRSPDLIGIEEVQDNSGQTDNGVVDASQSWNLLIQSIRAAGGPTYQYRQIDPVNNQDGGAPGGNIRVGFLFRTDRGLSFVDRPGGTSTNATMPVAGPGGAQLTFSPGRINPTHPGFADTRKSLAGEFLYGGKKLFVVVNHFSSKGDDQPLFGRFQPPTRFSEIARHQQAQVVNDFADQLLAVDPSANLIVLGDINDFEFSETIEILEGGVLTTLMKKLPERERYSYVFEGNSQVLDQILVSNRLLDPFNSSYDVVHVNAEFADQASDHDPQVAYIRLPGRADR